MSHHKTLGVRSILLFHSLHTYSCCKRIEKPPEKEKKKPSSCRRPRGAVNAVLVRSGILSLTQMG